MPDTYEKENEYLSEYLSTLKKEDGFKRVLSSPLRYPGGKTKAIGLILDNLPKLKRKRIISPFFGGGSFELCVSQNLGIEVVGYDIFGMLVNFWDVLIHHKDEFISELEKFEITPEEFTSKKKVELKDSDLTLLDDNKLLQAVYYYYNMTLSYGPMFLGWPSSNEINKEKFKRRLKKMKTMSFTNLSVECSDFEEVIKKHKDDFIFLDPPYYLGGDSKMFKGIYPNTNFAIHHDKFDHKKMCDLLKNHKGGFLITYNNCYTIREWYKDYKFEYPEWQYTYGQGETRIGKNRESGDGSNIKESHEIFIISWPH
jgi:DNA adenine methylase